MKFMSHSARRLALLAPVGLLVVAGCNSTPLRQSTAEFVSPTTWMNDGHSIVRPVASTTNRAPFYPLALRSAGEDGLINIDCTIDAAGQVRDASVANSTNQALNHSTLETVRGWTFQPATRDGVPIAMAVTLPVGYTILP